MTVVVFGLMVLYGKPILDLPRTTEPVGEKHETGELTKQPTKKPAEAKAEAKPAAAEPAPAPAPVYPVGCEHYRPLVEKYGWDVRTAMAVMRAESGCNPNAANWNDNHGVCQGSFGLFQISCHGGQIFDPAENVAAAWGKYTAINPITGLKQGWRPWGAYTNGAYLRYY